MRFSLSMDLLAGLLLSISPYADRDEAALLHMFDVNRAWSRKPQALPIRVHCSGRVIIACHRRLLLEKSWQEVTSTAIVKPRSPKR
jgi:hypothetical protein